jgi:regulator of protease activity HflC (stomatin/prohibitin superfamily)
MNVSTWIRFALEDTKDGPGSWVALLIIVAIAFFLAIRNVRIVPQATTYIIERLGAYQETWNVGVHVKIPFIDRISKIVSMKEKVADFQPQAVITKDNVTMQIDTVLFYQITDPKLFAYGIENPIIAIENLSATTLRNIIGDLELDQTLTSRDLINTKMRMILDEATDPWGIKVNRVELKNIIPPKEIQIAMERQMKAEREKRENILRAEGEKEAAIRVAEGDKTAAILRAEAGKEAAIREAEGQAAAILKVQEATAQGLRMIKDVGADQPLIALKSLETLARVADGQATKIIIPSEIQNLAGLAVSLREIAGGSLAEHAAEPAMKPSGKQGGNRGTV